MPARTSARAGRLGLSLKQVQEAVGEVAGLLWCPRHSLHIHTASRGVVAGALLVHNAPNDVWLDCSFERAGGHPVPGDVGAVLSMRLASAAPLILVVEKEAVFNTLLELQPWFLQGPLCGMVMISGRG